MSFIDWLNDHAGAVQVLFAAVLVMVTIIYAWSTHVISKATRKQAEASTEMVREMRQQAISLDRPYLLIETFNLNDVEWIDLSKDKLEDPGNACPRKVMYRILNAGKGPAKEVGTTVCHRNTFYPSVSKDTLRAGEDWFVEIEHKVGYAMIRESLDAKKGLSHWLQTRGVQIEGESTMDLGLVIQYRDIHDLSWLTYLRIGMTWVTDQTRKVVTSRTLIPAEQRIVECNEQAV